MRALLFALPLLLAACVDTGPPWTEESDFPVFLGNEQFENGFEPHEAGEPLYLELGFQGGQHIAYGLRVEGLTQDEPVDVIAWPVDASTGALILEPQESRMSLFPPDPAFYDDPPENVVEILKHIFFVANPDDVLDLDVELRVQVNRDDGRVGRAFSHGVVEWLPGQTEPATPGVR